jgi:methyl-accepting chemotaxis protein
MKIRNKLMLGFAATIAISATMGLYAAAGISRTTAMTGELYDKPLMAADFSRSALENFMRLDRAASIAVLSQDATALAELPEKAASLRETIEEDLEIVEERFPDSSAAPVLAEIREVVGGWTEATLRIAAAAAEPGGDAAAAARELRAARAELVAAAEEKFDLLVELAKGQGLDYRQEAARLGASTLLMIQIAVAASVAFGILVALFLARGIARPVTGMTATMTRLAAGETELVVPGLGRKDEVGEMAKALEVFKENAIEAARLAALGAAEAEEKTRRAERIAASTASFDTSASGFIRTVASAALELETTARAMVSITDQARQRADGASHAAESTSANVQTVAAATEELSGSTAEIGRQVTHSATIAGKAAEGAALADQRINNLAEMAQQIGKVVELIEQIAGQTNLLALNATIEAARAGDAGKGFAVVANEVKTLANQTAKATEEIRGQIEQIQGATTDAVDVIRTVGSTIGEVNAVAATIAAAVEQQAAATREIAGNVQRAAEGTVEVSANIGGATEMSAEVGASAGQVLTAASELSRESDRLKEEIESFLGAIRAA